MLKGVIECEKEKSWRLFDSIVINYHLFEIFNILSCWNPLSTFSSTFSIWTKSSLIKRINFSESEDIEFHFDSFVVFHWKIVPLHMTVCICIKSHVEIILLGRNPQVNLEVPSKRIQDFLIQSDYWIIIVYLLGFCKVTLSLSSRLIWVTWNSYQMFEGVGLYKLVFLWINSHEYHKW